MELNGKAARPLIRLKATLPDGTRVSIWRGWPSTWAAVDYAIHQLGSRTAVAQLVGHQAVQS